MKKQNVEIEADSLAGARDLLAARLDRNATMTGERVICDGEPRTLEGTGDTPEAALADARAKMPAGATIEKQDAVNAPAERICEITAFGPEEAAADAPVRPGGRIDAVAVKASGRKGVFGLGRKPSTYSLKLFDPATALRFVNLTVCTRKLHHGKSSSHSAGRKHSGCCAGRHSARRRTQD